MTRGVSIALGVLFAATAECSVAWAQMATADRVKGPGFWPTKGTTLRDDYVGTAVCARCHASHAETQPATSMARTAGRAEDAAPLRQNPALRFRSGGYRYEIDTSGGQSRYSVTDGVHASAAPLAWAFGAGKVGQTYLFERGGVVHEARMSYFESLAGADFTPGRALGAARDVEEAMARAVAEPEARRCFACHTTASTTADTFDRSRLVAGITCEACHGPGRRHVAAIEARRLGEGLAAILNPAQFDPAASVDFCGACHGTFWDVKLAGTQGTAALRSQPNRLQSSRCWGEGDPRITCVACHDPHQALVQDARAYDSRCLSCHVTARAKAGPEHPGRACRVGTERCVTCHMPKYAPKEMHHEFTDHLIRVVETKR